ncbi:MAG: FAD binding domain-containing protein [Acidovorax sp.]
MNTRPLQFVRRGQTVTRRNVPPDRRLLDLLREDLHATGCKQGCDDGGCGACAVVLGEAVEGRLRYRTVNACQLPAHALHGKALWTVEDLAQDPHIHHEDPANAGALHPAQEALVQCHGSQCGFCTPGFVMGLFGMYQNHLCQGRAITRAQAQQDLAGHLCRCTGYRPILDAAQTMHHLPWARVDEVQVLQKLELLALDGSGLEADSALYLAPTTLPALLAARAAHPQAQVVAGGTARQGERARVLDVTRPPELRRIETSRHHLHIGASAPLTEAFAALARHWPPVAGYAARFAGLAVRNVATLGGQLAHFAANGDATPLLIALRAQAAIASQRGSRQVVRHIAVEDFDGLAPDELIVRFDIPLPAPHAQLFAHKVSQRRDNDAATLSLAVQWDGRRASIGVSGVCTRPRRALRAEAALTEWSAGALARAGEALQAEFTPPTDLRASSAYRRALLASLMQRCWQESQGAPSLQTLTELVPA